MAAQPALGPIPDPILEGIVPAYGIYKHGKTIEHGAKTVAHDTGAVVSALFSANLWMRVGEVLLGVVFLAIGVMGLTKTTQTVAKLAPLAAA